MSRAWMPMYWGDYLRDTGHLTALEHGCYLLLIAHYWQHGGLPNDLRRVRLICKCPNNQWAATWKILTPFFSVLLNNSGSLELKHKRLDKEIEKSDLISSKRMISGAKGGLRNRGKNNLERNFMKAFASPKGRPITTTKNLSYLLDTPHLRKKEEIDEE